MKRKGDNDDRRGNKKGKTVYHFDQKDCVREFQYAQVKKNIEDGADVNAVRPHTDVTVLEIILIRFGHAAKQCDRSMVEYLLERGAKCIRKGIRMQDQALHNLVYYYGYDDLVRKLPREILRYVFPDTNYSLLDILLHRGALYSGPVYNPAGSLLEYLLEQNVAVTRETLSYLNAMLSEYDEYPCRVVNITLIKRILKQASGDLLCRAFISWTFPTFKEASMRLCVYCFSLPDFTLDRVLEEAQKMPRVSEASLYISVCQGVLFLRERLEMFREIPRMPRDIWRRIILQSFYDTSIEHDTYGYEEHLKNHDVFILAYINQLIRAPRPSCFSGSNSGLLARLCVFYLNNLRVWLLNSGVWTRDLGPVIAKASHNNQLKLDYIARVLHTAPDKTSIVRVINNLQV